MGLKKRTKKKINKSIMKFPLMDFRGLSSEICVENSFFDKKKFIWSIDWTHEINAHLFLAIKAYNYILF